MSPSERLYALALRALPGTLRRKHGAAMAALFRAQLREARRQGRMQTAKVSGLAVADVVRRGIYERWRNGLSDRVHGSERSRGEEGTMESLWRDVVLGMRSLTRARGFTAAWVRSSWCFSSRAPTWRT